MGITRKEVQKQFKTRGYTLKVDAFEEVLSFANRFQDAESEAIDVLLDELDNETLKSSILDKESVQRVVSLLLAAESAAGETADSSVGGARSALTFLDAFIIPKFRYTGRLPIHGDAHAKALLCKGIDLICCSRGFLFIHISLNQHLILNYQVLEAASWLLP